MNRSHPSADALARVQAALDQGSWTAALDLLDGIDSDAPFIDQALELRAQAAYGKGDLEAAVAAWEELHGVFVDRGDDAEAARAAAMIAMYLMMDTGLMAPVRGWLRRADRHLAGHDETAAHALVAMTRTYERFMCGDMGAAGEQATLAIELGTRLGVQPAVVIGRVASARVKIFEGRLDEGLDLLDEVAALLMSGAVDPLTTGMMYCELICAAQGLSMHDRAHEWTDVMEHWRHGAAFGGINGRCRVHRAEMLRITGPCDEAEEEALGACDELRPWMRREFGWPLTELGNIRLRKGDLEGAEEAFLAAHEHAWPPQPGLALLRLEQGDTTTASALITEALAHPARIPSKERPPFGDLCQAPLLDAQVAIAIAAGDLTTAMEAATSLTGIADAYPSRSLRACARLADARVALAGGNWDRAVEGAVEAVETWADIGAPFETAVARMVLGDAHENAGRPEAARLEREAAHRSFESFGARRWADRASEALGDSPHVPPAVEPLDAREQSASFRCTGDTREVTFAGQTVHVRDLKGLRYLERLLAEPNREFHVLDLVAVEQGTLPTVVSAVADDLHGADVSGLPALDQQALAAYRRRLAEVDDDIEEATRHNDVERVELAQRDRDYLLAELRRAVGIGGRHRAVGGTSERARTSVTRSLRYALARLAEHHPTLGRHLEQSVHTGTYCAYRPDPLTTITWITGWDV